MAQNIIQISSRGQITIPKEIRDAFGTNNLTYDLENGELRLRPLQTREEFFAELDFLVEDWKKTGISYSLEEIAKKYDL